MIDSIYKKKSEEQVVDDQKQAQIDLLLNK